MPKKAPVKLVKKTAIASKSRKVSTKTAKSVSSAKTPAGKNARTGPKKGRGRVTSPSGPLSSAVVAVLKRFKRPLSCREITDALVKKNYVFTHPDPKRILSIRIYKLKGVKKVSAGRFTAEEA